jgi:hypothetical protein
MLITCLAVELGVLALMGGVAGVVSGYWLAGVLLPDVAASLRGLYGAEVAGQLSLSPLWWLSGIGLSLLGALLAGANSCGGRRVCRCWRWPIRRPGIRPMRAGCGARAGWRRWPWLSHGWRCCAVTAWPAVSC